MSEGGSSSGGTAANIGINFIFYFFYKIAFALKHCVLCARQCGKFSVTEVTKNRKLSQHRNITTEEEARQIHFVEVREAVYHKTSATQPPKQYAKFPGLRMS